MATAQPQLVTILSASIAPVIVISGVGLLLLSMTNRHSRVIDRARDLVKDLEAADEPSRRASLVQQVQIIYRRARILRLAIVLAALSILFVAVTVLLLFTSQILGLGVEYFAVPCFGLSLVALIGSLYFFIRDVGLSLAALELETGPVTSKVLNGKRRL
jgi:polyferredoxin